MSDDDEAENQRLVFGVMVACSLSAVPTVSSGWRRACSGLVLENWLSLIMAADRLLAIIWQHLLRVELGGDG